jgi:hypothetical protein
VGVETRFFALPGALTEQLQNEEVAGIAIGRPRERTGVDVDRTGDQTDERDAIDAIERDALATIGPGPAEASCREVVAGGTEHPDERVGPAGAGEVGGGVARVEVDRTPKVSADDDGPVRFYGHAGRSVVLRATAAVAPGVEPVRVELHDEDILQTGAGLVGRRAARRIEVDRPGELRKPGPRRSAAINPPHAPRPSRSKLSIDRILGEVYSQVGPSNIRTFRLPGMPR